MHDYDVIFNSFKSGKMKLFYEKLYPGLLLYASRQLGDDLSYLAEDCVQDSILNSFINKNKFNSSYAWYAYILKCIFHSSLQIIRKHKSCQNFIDYTEDNHVERDIETEILEQEILNTLYAAINSLSDKQKAILQFTYSENLKVAEIAKRMGVAEITIKKQKAQILFKLRDFMQQNPQTFDGIDIEQLGHYITYILFLDSVSLHMSHNFS